MEGLAQNQAIPVLTDILQSPEARRANAAPATASLDKLPWDELEARLTERIRQQVTERLNFVLDDSITQHVSSILGQMAMLLTEEIRHDMQQTLEVIVTHTISTEIQRLKQNRQPENRKTPPA
jgi:hypothetical protein